MNVFLVLAFFLPFNLWSIIVINLGVLLVNESGRVCNFFGIYRVVIWPNFEENREVFMKKEKREAEFFFSLFWFFLPCKIEDDEVDRSTFDRFSQSLTGSTLFQPVQPVFEVFQAGSSWFVVFGTCSSSFLNYYCNNLVFCL